MSWVAICSNENVPLEVHQQKQWDIPLVQKIHQELFQALDNDTDRASFFAVSSTESNHWLQALPSTNSGTLLDGESLRVAVGTRLGAPICQPHICACGFNVNRCGLHGLACQKNDGKRPDGLTLIPWERDKVLVWDATCVDTLAASHLRGTSVRAGAASEAAEVSKCRKYESISTNYLFLPLAMETLGPWGPKTNKFFSKINNITGDKKAGSFLAQRLSITIQRGNAASVLGTMPRGVGLLDL